MKLYRIADNQFIVTSENQAKYSRLFNVVRFMTELGVEVEEIELGIASLMSNSHNVAHYGVNLKFIFSEFIFK